MKKIILSIIAISFAFGVYAQNLAQADSVWTVIKNETVRGANTATRIGGAGNAIIAGIRDTLANFFTSTDLSNYVTLTDSQNISGNKYFNKVVPWVGLLSKISPSKAGKILSLHFLISSIIPSLL